jgi:hypothetical protein
VLETTNCSSVSRPVDFGREFGADPVAIIIFFALIYSVPPALRSISISCGEANLPHPLMYVTPFFLNKYSIPPVSPSTAFYFDFIN